MSANLLGNLPPRTHPTREPTYQQTCHRGRFLPENLPTRTPPAKAPTCHGTCPPAYHTPTGDPSYQAHYLPGNLHTREPTYRETTCQGTFLPGNVLTREPTYSGNDLPAEAPAYQGTYLPRPPALDCLASRCPLPFCPHSLPFAPLSSVSAPPAPFALAMSLAWPCAFVL